jgi:hypothetical protein
MHCSESNVLSANARRYAQYEDNTKKSILPHYLLGPCTVRVRTNAAPVFAGLNKA